MAVGVLMPARSKSSLKLVAPLIQRNLATTGVILYLLFGLATICIVAASALKF
jgi:hypothetical protein